MRYIQEGEYNDRAKSVEILNGEEGKTYHNLVKILKRCEGKKIVDTFRNKN